MKVAHLFAAVLLLVAVAATLQAFAASRGIEMSIGAEYLWYVTFSYAVALIVEADRRPRGLPAPFEYAAFVFFAWPLVATYYFYQTRGWRGLGMGLGLILLSLVPDLTAFVAAWLG